MLSARRLWLYFRWGNGSYLSFFLSTAQFITVEYYLFLQKTGFPLKLWQFAVIFGAIYFITGILFGVFHKLYQSGTDVAVVNLTSPYTYKAMPGKEIEVYLPTTIFGLQMGMVTLEALGKLTPELKLEYEMWIAKLNDLREGKEFR